MYHATKILIKQDNELFNYCSSITKATNNLRNAALFRVRQVLTMVDKPIGKLTQNELEVYNELVRALPKMGKKYQMPTKGKTFLSYYFLNALFSATENDDFFCSDLPRQTAQHVLKEVAGNMKDFYALCRSFWKNPSSYNGKPKLPHYAPSGGQHKAILTNQQCVVYENADGTKEVKIPKVKQHINIGKAPIDGTLKQTEIVPFHGIFKLVLVWDDGKLPPKKKAPKRMCSIDVGVNNLAAITNNIGEPCLLFKGEVIKSANQYFNRQMAKYQSGQADKRVLTPDMQRLYVKRDNRIRDFLNKAASRIVSWCVQSDIDTIVIGVNKEQKQNSHLGKANNQMFVQIPFDYFRQYISFRAERYGINVITHEESYTSQASFLGKDYIPTYGVDDEKANFSGKRTKRGVYRTNDGIKINADLNGSANILRKTFPNAFTVGIMPIFNKVKIYKHPDSESIIKSSPSGI